MKVLHGLSGKYRHGSKLKIRVPRYPNRAFLDHGEAMMTVLEDSEKIRTLRKYQHPCQINLKNVESMNFQCWIRASRIKLISRHLLWIFILSKWETSRKNQKCCAPNRCFPPWTLSEFWMWAFFGSPISQKNPVAHPTYPLYILSGWWLTYPSEKYEFVRWDYDIPNWMEK